MTASCPTTIPQGAKTVTVALLTGKEGTPPYTLKWYVDGSEKTISPVWDPVNKRWTFTYMFNETVGTHIYKSVVTDSCTNVSENSCTIKIEEAGISPMIITVGVGVLALGAAYLLLRRR